MPPPLPSTLAIFGPGKPRRFDNLRLAVVDARGIPPSADGTPGRGLASLDDGSAAVEVFNPYPFPVPPFASAAIADHDGFTFLVAVEAPVAE
jgi:hypothetical protein